MKKVFIVLSIVSMGVLFNLSCSKSGTTGGGGSLDCTSVPKTWSMDVNPIVQGFCNNGSGCHGLGSTNGPGPLTNYSQVSAAASRIRPQIASGAMPQGSTLTTAQKNSFLCWIDSGAPNN